MNHRLKPALILFIIFLDMVAAAAIHAHSVNYSVGRQGIAIRVYYSENDPAAYSQYELYGPGDREPHQIGRMDKNGFCAFVPDRPGRWKLQVWGESTHGYHGVTTEIDVDGNLGLGSFSKPLVAGYTKIVTGISLIIGLFGFYAFWRSRRRIPGSGEDLTKT